jgi:hypothetical protein
MLTNDAKAWPLPAEGETSAESKRELPDFWKLLREKES